MFVCVVSIESVEAARALDSTRSVSSTVKRLFRRCFKPFFCRSCENGVLDDVLRGFMVGYLWHSGILMYCLWYTYVSIIVPKIRTA